MIEREIAEHFLGKYVVMYTNGKILYGRLSDVTDSALILKNRKFGVTVRSLESIDGIEEHLSARARSLRRGFIRQAGRKSGSK